jgi:hypothetical protein
VNYSDAGYAESLAEFGTPRSLPRSGGWLLERQVPDGSPRDLVGPYPLFSCSDWEGLQADLDELEGEAVSVVLVADPLTAPGEARLREAFRDRVVPFKRHHVRDLDEAAEPPAHHRRHIRRAAGAVEVELCARPLDRLDDWVRLSSMTTDAVTTVAGLVERAMRDAPRLRAAACRCGSAC